MANNFQPGHLTPVKFAPAVANGVRTLLNITGYNGDIESALHICTHTGTNGIAARIAGVRDASFTVTADFDMDAPPYLQPPLIQDGVAGVMYAFVSAPITAQQIALGVSYQGPPLAIQIPIIIGKVHYEAAIGSQVKYSWDAKMNAFAGAFQYNVAA